MPSPAGRSGATAGAVLIGGASRRLGTDKVALPVGGVPLLDRSIDLLRAAGLRPVLTVGGVRDVAGGDLHLDDVEPGEGPLAGICAVLSHLSGPDTSSVVIVAVDLPQLTVATVKRLVDGLRASPEADVAAVRGPRGPEPLVAAWRTTVAERVRAAYDEGRRAPRDVLAQLAVAEVDPDDPEELADVDTPADLERLGRIAARGRPGAQWAVEGGTDGGLR